MSTKKRIIAQAIKSYNSEGLTNVTSRDLAQSLEMSHGNLEYHFKTKENLLKAIYIQMKADISEVYEQIGASEDALVRFNELIIRLEKFHRTYSFFNLDVLEISRNYPELNKLLAQTFQVRKEQMTHFYHRFEELGYFKKELHPGIYIRLQHTVRILITFWNSQKEVLPYFETAQKATMSSYIWDLLLPHMTEEGLITYHNIVLENTETV